MIKVFINLKNPLVMNREPVAGAWHNPLSVMKALSDMGIHLPEDLAKDIREYVRDNASEMDNGIDMPKSQRAILDRIVSHLKSLGYDGIIYRNQYEGESATGPAKLLRLVQPNQNSYIVFDKRQISKPVYDMSYNMERLASGDSAFSQVKNPQFKRGVNTLLRLLNSEKISYEQFAARVEALAAQRPTARGWEELSPIASAGVSQAAVVVRGPIVYAPAVVWTRTVVALL